MRHMISGVILTCTLQWASPHVMAAGEADLARAKTRTCVRCHGIDGNSIAANTPRLSGQVPEYLVKQMRDLRSGKRDHGRGVSLEDTPPTDEDIAIIAAYYAEQRITTVAAERGQSILGEQIYTKGKKVPNFVPACVGCHGLQGKGKADWKQLMSAAPTVMPSSIGGQHPGYVTRQLKAFRNGDRTNDEAAIMRKLAENLTDDEIAAVAIYVGALNR